MVFCRIAAFPGFCSLHATVEAAPKNSFSLFFANLPHPAIWLFERNATNISRSILTLRPNLLYLLFSSFLCTES